MKKLIYLLFIVVFFFACKKEGINNDPEIKKEHKTEFNLLNYTQNSYSRYFEKTDNVIGINALKYSHLKKYQTGFHIKDVDNNKSFSINNISTNNYQKSSKKNLFGRTNHFRISVNDHFHKSSNDTLVDLYIPELVEITNPMVNNIEESYPKCMANDFVIEWNADSNNPNGLYVIVDYKGSNAIPVNSEEKRVVNVEYIANDDGRTTLNPDLFQNIPNLAFADVSLIRGDVQIIDFNNETYKIYAESHMKLPIIVVKDITKIEKK